MIGCGIFEHNAVLSTNPSNQAIEWYHKTIEYANKQISVNNATESDKIYVPFSIPLDHVVNSVAIPG